MTFCIIYECPLYETADDNTLAEDIKAAMFQATKKLVAQCERTPATHCTAPEGPDVLFDRNGNRRGYVSLQGTPEEAMERVALWAGL